MCPSTSGSEWVARLATELGVAVPTPEEVDILLGLAGVAAHASERTAAPLSTWLVGRAGVPPAEAAQLARRLADELETGAPAGGGAGDGGGAGGGGGSDSAKGQADGGKDEGGGG